MKIDPTQSPTPAPAPKPTDDTATTAPSIVLVAGSGFTSATPQPPNQGAPAQPGYNAKAMARWNFVPHQTFQGEFAIGIVAFHAYGIERVEFSLDGGPWKRVAATSLNTMSGTDEYWVKIDPGSLSAGEHEVRAVVYPKVGLPRVLAGALNGSGRDNGEYSMYFVADPTGTMPRMELFVSPTGSDTSGNGTREQPYQTIMKAAKSIANANGGKADGGIVNLLPGNHHYGGYSYSLLTSTERRWITIRPAKGVVPSTAPIVSGASEGTRIPHVKFERVVFRPSGTTNTIVLSDIGLRRLWLDRCAFEGAGRTIMGDWINGWEGVWSTDCTLTNSMNGLSGELVRNMRIDTVGSDAFSGGDLVVNSTVRTIDNTGTDFHPDFFQMYTGAGSVVENRIVLNSKALETINSQGLFAGNAVSIKDIAFVGVEVNTRIPGGVFNVFQFAGSTTHMLVERCDLRGPINWRADLNFSGSDILMRGTKVTTMPQHPAVTWIDCEVVS